MFISSLKGCPTRYYDEKHQFHQTKTNIGQASMAYQDCQHVNLEGKCYIIDTSRVAVEGKSSVCVICMKYRIIFYYHQPVSKSIIVYCKHLMHARTRVSMNPRERPDTPHTQSYCRRCIAIRCQPTVTARSAGDNSGSLAFGINTGTGGQVSPRV